MNYLKWNEVLASNFFNELNAEKPVNLFITKDEIIKIGEQYFSQPKDEIIWNDFVNAVKEDLSGYQQDNKLIKRASDKLYYFKHYRQNYQYPPYFIYLLLSIYPFTEFSEDIDAKSYYKPVNEILSRDGLPTWTTLNQQYNWIDIWQDLEYWSIVEKNLQLGYFAYIQVSSQKYIDYPRTQALLKPGFYKKFKQLLFDQEIGPGTIIPEIKLINLISENKSILELKDNIIKVLKDKEHPLHLSVITKIKNFIKNWDGVADIHSVTEIEQHMVIAKVYLCFEIKEEYKLNFYLRIFSNYPFPPDLSLKDKTSHQNFPLQEEKNGWSKRIEILALKNLYMEDTFNQWRANFILNDVIIFVDASRYSLFNNFISVDLVEAGERCYLMIKNSLTELDDLTNFYSNSLNGCISKKDDDFDNIPEGFSFYLIENIKAQFPPFINFREANEIEVKIQNGIQIYGRKFLKYIVPEVLVEGLDPQLNLLVRFKNSGDIKELKRSYKKEIPLWSLKTQDDKPLPYNSPFEFCYNSNERNISIGKGYYELMSSDKYHVGDNIPCTNSFGHVTSVQNESVGLCGNSFINDISILKSNNRCYGNLFCIYNSSVNNLGFPQFQKWDYDPNSELLLNYLSIKGEVNISEFFNAFKTIYLRENKSIDSEDINILSRLSLNYYSILGFVTRFGDYGEKILTNKPQLLQLPGNKLVSGKRFLIKGARTKSLITQILNFCKDNRKSFHIDWNNHDETTKKFLLPRSLILTISVKSNEELLKSINLFCNSNGLLFQSEIIYTLGLLSYVSSLDKYLSSLQSDVNFKVYDAKKRIFDVDKLKFIKVNTLPVRKNLIVEYQFNPYTYIYKYYSSNYSYTVDKNLGIYLTLAANKIKVISYDRAYNSITIPSSTPLPFLFARILYLMSGSAPANFQDASCMWFQKYGNIDSVVADIILEKLNQK
ncbi:MAG: hypothetical protein ACYCVH_10625 [Ignavibacteriaceae bacterium]